MVTDLANDPAPPGGAVVTISAAAFKRWMTACGYERAPGDNPNQEVYYLKTAESFKTETKDVKPNWHITAMTTLRNGGDCVNFHFKIEIAKETSHYWHYVVHYVPAGATWHWVGDPNPHNNQTNQGGGKAAGNLQLLRENLTRAESACRVHGLDKTVGKKTQAAMVKKLRELVSSNQMFHDVAAGRLD